MMASALMGYIALYKPLKSKLNRGRALRLSQSAMELSNNHIALVEAMGRVVATLTEKVEKGEERTPLKNHNYLKPVLKNVQAELARDQTLDSPQTSTGPNIDWMRGK
jgi:hypothetical protein